jgi:hypothetical protein
MEEEQQRIRDFVADMLFERHEFHMDIDDYNGFDGYQYYDPHGNFLFTTEEFLPVISDGVLHDYTPAQIQHIQEMLEQANHFDGVFENLDRMIDEETDGEENETEEEDEAEDTIFRYYDDRDSLEVSLKMT